MDSPLDNVFWNALSGLQARYACGTQAARRFGPGFSPIAGFADARRPDFTGLDAWCARGERFYCDAWPGDAPASWQVQLEAPMSQMVWDAPEAAASHAGPDPVLLATKHAGMMLELSTATNPNPFGPRTPQLGEYWGIFDGERLVAMAGERAHVPGFREISGVCTHPGYRGRGYARELVALLVRRQLARGETPFLHVLLGNETARSLYREMGFALRRTEAVRVIARL